MKRTTWIASAALAALALLSGCAEQRYVIVRAESTPTSAEVWLKTGDGAFEQRDSTPCDVLFRDPGEYEVQIRKPGYLFLMRRVTILEEPGKGGEPRLKAIPQKLTVSLDPVEDKGGGKPAANPDPYYYGD